MFTLSLTNNACSCVIFIGCVDTVGKPHNSHSWNNHSCFSRIQSWTSLISEPAIGPCANCINLQSSQPASLKSILILPLCLLNLPLVVFLEVCQPEYIVYQSQAGCSFSSVFPVNCWSVSWNRPQILSRKFVHICYIIIVQTFPIQHSIILTVNTVSLNTVFVQLMCRS